MTDDQDLAPLLRTAQLGGRSDSQTAIEFVPETWIRWLSDDHLDLAESVRRLAGDDPNPSVDRTALVGLARLADSHEARRELFVATLVWGRGKRNGRMRDAVLATLNAPELDRVLENTQSLARGGRPSDAYAAWTLQRGIREAFFTKWLWASSHGPDDAEFSGLRPLVLDARVWKSLGVLGWSSIEAAGTRSRASRYQTYVAALHQWASELSTESLRILPEDLEVALFDANGEFAAEASDQRT
jgi:hypothetical protein